jgi:hypothetical protein
MGKWGWGARAGLFWGGLVCGFTATPASAQIESPFAIRVEAPEVVVPVVVLDRTPRIWNGNAFDEVDEQITDLAIRDFRILEDGVVQHVDNVALELPRVRDVQDNLSHHIENSYTPRGIWASADLWPSKSGPTLSPLATYLVSYTPAPSSAGSCHRINVQVKRRHATVYARDEYCNTQHPLTDPLGGTKLGQRMVEFADSGEEGEIPVSVQAGWIFGDVERSHVDVAIEFPSAALSRKWVKVNLYATAAVMGVVRDKNGTIVTRFSDMSSTASWNFYRGPLPPDHAFLAQWEAAAIPGRYETQVDLRRGTYKMQIVITDGVKFGKREVSLVVDGIHPDSVGLGDVLLCKRFHPVLEGAQAADGAPKFVPLISAGQEFNPAGDMRFHPGQPLVGYFEIYGATANKANFRVRVRAAKSANVKLDTGWQTVQSKSGGANHVIPIAAEIATEGLPSGEYELEVEAGNAANEETVKRTKAFEVVQ